MREFLFGLFGGLSAVSIEVLFKRYPGVAWFPYLWLATLPLQAIINFSIWQILQHDSILGVAIWFSASTAILRLGAVLWLGTPIGTLTWMAYGLTISALFLKFGEMWRAGG